MRALVLGWVLNGNPFSEIYYGNQWKMGWSWFWGTSKCTLLLAPSCAVGWGSFCVMSLLCHFPPCSTRWWQRRLTGGPGFQFFTVTDSFSQRLKNAKLGSTGDSWTLGDERMSYHRHGQCLGAPWGPAELWLGRTWWGRLSLWGQGRACPMHQTDHNTSTLTPLTLRASLLTFIGGFCALKFWWEKWLCSPPPFWQATQRVSWGSTSHQTEAAAATVTVDVKEVETLNSGGINIKLGYWSILQKFSIITIWVYRNPDFWNPLYSINLITQIYLRIPIPHCCQL